MSIYEDERMLNTFAMRLFGSKPCKAEEYEVDDESEALLNSKNKSNLKRRGKKNKVNKRRKIK